MTMSQLLANAARNLVLDDDDPPPSLRLSTGERAFDNAQHDARRRHPAGKATSAPTNAAARIKAMPSAQRKAVAERALAEGRAQIGRDAAARDARQRAEAEASWDRTFGRLGWAK